MYTVHRTMAERYIDAIRNHRSSPHVHCTSDVESFTLIMVSNCDILLSFMSEGVDAFSTLFWLANADRE